MGLMLLTNFGLRPRFALSLVGQDEHLQIEGMLCVLCESFWFSLLKNRRRFASLLSKEATGVPSRLAMPKATRPR